MASQNTSRLACLVSLLVLGALTVSADVLQTTPVVLETPSIIQDKDWFSEVAWQPYALRLEESRSNLINDRCLEILTKPRKRYARAWNKALPELFAILYQHAQAEDSLECYSAIANLSEEHSNYHKLAPAVLESITEQRNRALDSAIAQLQEAVALANTVCIRITWTGHFPFPPSRLKENVLSTFTKAGLSEECEDLPDVLVEISVTTSPLSARYFEVSGSRSEIHFSGASAAGSVHLRTAQGSASTTFEGTVPTPYSVYMGAKTERLENAPYHAAVTRAQLYQKIELVVGLALGTHGRDEASVASVVGECQAVEKVRACQHAVRMAMEPDSDRAVILSRLREQLAWAEARAADTVSSYEQFVVQFPASGHLLVANKRLAILRTLQAFNQASTLNTVDSYVFFLGEYPSAGLERQARDLLVRRAWQDAQETNSAGSYERFLRAAYSEKSLRLEATRRLEELGDDETVTALRQMVVELRDSGEERRVISVVGWVKGDERGLIFKDENGAYQVSSASGITPYSSGLELPHLKYMKPLEGLTILVSSPDDVDDPDFARMILKALWHIVAVMDDKSIFLFFPQAADETPRSPMSRLKENLLEISGD